MIVCMSRRICVELYEAIRKLRPDWHHEDDDKGVMKIVMTGSASDPLRWQAHIRNKPRREALAKRFKDPKDPFKIVIVRDMWLTGFDAPCLHTMYVDKPMRSHGLMQAIARVNRVFKDKPGGLVVDYLGLAHELKQALAAYTESGGHGETAIDQEEAVAVMLEKYEVCCDFFHGFDWSKWTSGTPAQKLGLLPAAQEHILAMPVGKKRIPKNANRNSCKRSRSFPKLSHWPCRTRRQLKSATMLVSSRRCARRWRRANGRTRRSRRRKLMWPSGRSFRAPSPATRSWTFSRRRV